MFGGEVITMSIQDILTGGGAAFVIMTLIQIMPIKVNPWSAIAKAIGRSINCEVIAKVEKLSNDLQEVKDTEDERAAVDARVRILHFGDELYRNVRHSKEHFDQILSDITKYERYCREHPEFENDKAVITVQNIKAIYQRCLEEHDFL